MKREERLINPFKPGNGIEPPYLAGRDEELRWFEKSLDTALVLPRNLVISGLRGTGKTVLLKEFGRLCKKKKWLFVQREFDERYCNEQEFTSALLIDIVSKARGMPIKGKKLTKQKIGFIVTEEIPENEDLLSHLLSQYSGLLIDRLESILRDLYSTFAESGFRGLVFMYDEFHTIRDKKIPGNFPLSTLLETFGHLQSKGCRYYLVLSGLPSLFSNLIEAKTYSERMFSVKELSSLSKEATINGIIKPLNLVSRTFDSDLIDKLVEETSGYPYFIQFYGYYLVDMIEKSHITIRDFQKVCPLLLRELDNSFFAGRFARASDSERNILIAMSRISGVSTTAKIHQEIKNTKLKMTYDSLRMSLKRLEEKNLIYKKGRGIYDFTLPLFGKFILRWTERN